MVQEAFKPPRVQACMRFSQDIVIMRHLAEPVSDSHCWLQHFTCCKSSREFPSMLESAADAHSLVGRFVVLVAVRHINAVLMALNIGCFVNLGVISSFLTVRSDRASVSHTRNSSVAKRQHHLCLYKAYTVQLSLHASRV